MSGRRAAVIGALWLAAQLAVPLARLDASKRPPFSPRFSWSMFAGRPLARCAHAITLRGLDGASFALPLPAPPSPVFTVLSARTPDEFVRVVPLLTAYAESDEDVIRTLHELLRRHKHAIDPAGRTVLESTLDCRTWEGVAFRRTLRLGPR